MPSVSAQELKTKESVANATHTRQQQSMPHRHLQRLHSQKISVVLLFCAMQLADYMTPPKKKDCSELVIMRRVHLLGHVAINSMEKILHNNYNVQWTSMRNNTFEATKDYHACQSHGIYQVSYYSPRSVLPDNIFHHIAIDLVDVSITTLISGNNFMLLIIDYYNHFCMPFQTRALSL